MRAVHGTVISSPIAITLCETAMMRFLFSCLAFAFGLVVPATASADTGQPVLIEIFASQNCLACPQAHRTLKAVQEAHGEYVLVLTWSVDYWDYLGAPDPMAMPAASERQAAYAERLGLRAPYTPQSVYDGAMQGPATRRKAVETNIKTRASADRRGRVSFESLGNGQFSLDGYALEPVEVHLVEYLTPASNATAMVHPVTRTQSLGRWTGGRVRFSYACEESCAAIVQAPGHGEVIAAHRLN